MNKKLEGAKLKEKLDFHCISMKSISDGVDMPYSTVAQQLSGYTPLSEKLKKYCEDKIKEVAG